MSFDCTNAENYVIAYKRFARDITTIELPKEMAISEYATIKGFGLSKAMGSSKSKDIIESEGTEQKDCIDYLQLILK